MINTTPISRQAYLDLLVETSRTGGFPAVDEAVPRLPCRYRTPDGRKCAVGLLIPDDRYSPSMEGDSALAVIKDYALSDRLPVGMSDRDLERVQETHDGMATRPREFGAPGREVAPWDHPEFVRRLGALPCFAGCTFPEVPAPC